MLPTEIVGKMWAELTWPQRRLNCRKRLPHARSTDRRQIVPQTGAHTGFWLAGPADPVRRKPTSSGQEDVREAEVAENLSTEVGKKRIEERAERRQTRVHQI